MIRRYRNRNIERKGTNGQTAAVSGSVAFRTLDCGYFRDRKGRMASGDAAARSRCGTERPDTGADIQAGKKEYKSDLS